MCSGPSLLNAVVGAVGLVLACGAATAADPAFTYESQTGVLRLEADLDPGATLVSWLIPGPQALEILAFQNGTSSQGCDWVQGYFDAKEQWIALAGDGITGSWDVARYATGLDLSAFGQVEFGLRYAAGGGATGFTIVTAPPQLPGDLDGDGFVGLADLDIVLGNWNQQAPPADVRADPTGDGFVGLGDLDIVLGHWNQGTPPALSTTVPEPASASGLIVLAMVVLIRRDVIKFRFADRRRAFVR